MKKTILHCHMEHKSQLYFYKESAQHGHKYTVIIDERMLSEVDSFTKLIRLLRLEDVSVASYSIVDGEEEYVKAFKVAQKGELSYYNAKERIVDLCQRLLKGEPISATEDAMTYGVHTETIKSDMYTLRNILKDYSIDYDGVYKLSQVRNFSTAEAFLLLIMIYHSKSLNYEDVKKIKDKLLKQFSGAEQQALSRFFQSYSYYYRPFIKQSQLQSIERVFRAISEQKLISFTYKNKCAEVKRKVVKPLTVILHDRMYYLVGKQINSEVSQPINYRFDRVTDIVIEEEKYKIDESNRFQQGQYIEESFNMYTGKKEKICFKAKSIITEYVQRHFPHAVCIAEEKDGNVYEVIVRGTGGIVLWLLSQKSNVEVLSPLHMRDQMKQIISEMYKLYEH